MQDWLCTVYAPEEKLYNLLHASLATQFGRQVMQKNKASYPQDTESQVAKAYWQASWWQTYIVQGVHFCFQSNGITSITFTKCNETGKESPQLCPQQMGKSDDKISSLERHFRKLISKPPFGVSRKIFSKIEPYLYRVLLCFPCLGSRERD